MGLTRNDVIQMPWGELILMMQARADEYQRAEEPKEASFAQIRAWAGA